MDNVKNYSRVSGKIRREYPCTRPRPKRGAKRSGETVTIGIGLLCEGGKSILLGADKRGSYGSMTVNDECGKLFELPHGFQGAISGDISTCEQVISELFERIDKLSQWSVEFVKKAALEAAQHTHIAMLQGALMKNCGITWDHYLYDRKIVKSVRAHAEAVVRETPLGVQAIIAGFNRQSPILLVSTEDFDWREEVSPGIALIGSGSGAAQYWLNFRRQNYGFSVPRSYCHLVEAKRFSELDRFVGPVAQYVLIAEKGLRFLEGQDSLVTRWDIEFGLKKTDSLDADLARQKFNEAFKDCPFFPSSTSP